MFLYWLRGPEGSWKNRGCCQISRPPDMHEGSPTVKPGQPPGSKLHVSKMLIVFFFPGESFLFSSSAFRHRNDWKQKHLLKGKIIHSLNWIEILSTLIFFMQGKVKSKFQMTLGNHFLHIICSHGFIYSISFGGL